MKQIMKRGRKQRYISSTKSVNDINASEKELKKHRKTNNDSMNLEADFNDVSKESTKINFNVEFQQLSAITEPTIDNLYKILLAALKQSINLEKTVSRVLDELKDVKLEVKDQKENLKLQKN